MTTAPDYQLPDEPPPPELPPPPEKPPPLLPPDDQLPELEAGADREAADRRRALALQVLLRLLVPVGARQDHFGEREADHVDPEQDQRAPRTPRITIGNIAQNGIRKK